jgi:hypothetical protein
VDALERQLTHFDRRRTPEYTKLEQIKILASQKMNSLVVRFDLGVLLLLDQRLRTSPFARSFTYTLSSRSTVAIRKMKDVLGTLL